MLDTLYQTADLLSCAANINNISEGFMDGYHMHYLLQSKPYKSVCAHEQFHKIRLIHFDYVLISHRFHLAKKKHTFK